MSAQKACGPNRSQQDGGTRSSNRDLPFLGNQPVASWAVRGIAEGRIKHHHQRHVLMRAGLSWNRQGKRRSGIVLQDLFEKTLCPFGRRMRNESFPPGQRGLHFSENL